MPRIVDPSEIAAQEAAIRSESDQKLAALKAQRDAETRRREPLLTLLAERERAAGLIESVFRHREVHAQRDREFRSRLAAGIGSADASYLWQLFASDPAGAHAERILREIDVWLTNSRAALADAEQRAVTLAATLELGHLLPADLQRAQR